MKTQQAVSGAEIKAGLQIMAAVASAVRDSGPLGIPSGHIYSMLIGRVDIHGYEAMIRTLVRTGLVEQRHHCLYWTGGEI